jgi:hypothetical protein
VRRWIFVAAALLAAALALVSLRDRGPSPAPDSEEIDDASKEALREILEQEEE